LTIPARLDELQEKQEVKKIGEKSQTDSLVKSRSEETYKERWTLRQMSSTDAT